MADSGDHHHRGKALCGLRHFGILFSPLVARIRRRLPRSTWDEWRGLLLIAAGDILSLALVRSGSLTEILEGE